MNIIYCFYKRGDEGIGWSKDLISSSNDSYHFIPFNQEGYLDISEYWDAVKLDRLYQNKDPRLMRMYSDFEKLLEINSVQAMVVCDGPPFHPDYLMKLPIYRVLYSHDDPESTYQRNIPYLHAYHHVFYVSPAYNEDMDMDEKMKSCGMTNRNFIPNGVLGFDFDETISEEALFGIERDIDILFIGAFSWNKIDILVKMKKEFGKRFQWSGYVRPKHNLYLTAKYFYPFWIKPVTFSERLLLHQRAKIVVNMHNGYSVPNFGNQRLFYGPANGCMLITDGIKHIDFLYKDGEDVVGYSNVNDLINKCHYYIEHPEERNQIARNGFRRVLKEYKFTDITRRSGEIIEKGIMNVGWVSKS